MIAPPFRGHLHPLLGIALELAPSHTVRVLSTPGTMHEVHACGLHGRALLGAADEARLEAISNPRQTIGHHPGRLLEQFRATLDVLASARVALETLYADADQRPDLVIADFTLPIAGIVAARHGVPWWTSLPSPCVLETRRGPPAYLGGLRPIRGPVGRWRDGAGRALVRGFKGSVARLERKRLTALGLGAVYRDDGTEQVYSPGCILALGLESFEFGCGWPAAVHFVGPRLLTPPGHALAPTFREGRRHVLVTCGTHLAHRRAAFAAAAATLARMRPDLEVHVSAGQVPKIGDPSCNDEPLGDRTVDNAPANLVRLPWVDYARHVRRYDAVVHHGGAGILWHCLANAVPAIVVPVDYDQPDHAARLGWAGVARQARLDGLVSAVGRVLDDPELAARCRDIACRIRAERERQGVRTLVERLGSSDDSAR